MVLDTGLYHVVDSFCVPLRMPIDSEPVTQSLIDCSNHDAIRSRSVLAALNDRNAAAYSLSDRSKTFSMEVRLSFSLCNHALKYNAEAHLPLWSAAE